MENIYLRVIIQGKSYSLLKKSVLGKGGLIFLFFAFSINGDAQQCLQSSKYFRIDSATKMTEHAGVYGGGSSVSYEVFLTVKRRHLEYFDSAWSHGSGSMIFLVLPKSKSKAEFNCRKNGHFRLICSMNYNNDPAPEMKNQSGTEKPIDCRQELILRYKAKRKLYYIVLNKFKTIPTINLP